MNTIIFIKIRIELNKKKYNGDININITSEVKCPENIQYNLNIYTIIGSKNVLSALGLLN